MKANAVSFLSIFETKLRLEVPLFQRQYVWSREQQWEPLWEDISRKFEQSLEKQEDAPPHFLGAMVLDQKQTPTTHVEKRQVIDGQQRLITLQIFLSAFRDFCTDQKCDELATECGNFILNKGMMADPTVEKFKVWPTRLDRDQFADVVTLGSLTAVTQKHPRVYRKYARKPEPRPRMVEAYLYFYDQIFNFFIGSEIDKPLADDQPLASRIDRCFQTLKNALKVAVIDLDSEDDAQVIFETLNARGEPLLPADLLRNFIFLRAGRQGEPQQELYDQYWQKFDDDFWRHEISQGRLFRPRSDLFMQHFLASRRMTDIPIKHLFVEYKFWINKNHPFKSVREELVALADQRDDFRRLLEPKSDDSLYQLSSFLISFDISTVYPLLLFLLNAKVSESEWNTISVMLESYLLRRAVCNLTTKGYNRIFIGLGRFLQEIDKSTDLEKKGSVVENINKYLSGLTGDSAEWPKDEKFFEAWQSNPTYQTLDSSKLVHILRRLSNSYLTSKTESISIDSPLTIEHVLPQDWLENWLLQDGSKGMTFEGALASEEGNSVAEATVRRYSMLQTLGNLTILTQPLNSAVSNSAWKDKKPQLLQSSLLPINQQLVSYEKWDEETIERRGKELFARALLIWPAPSRNPEKS
jgi:hypothetical protein